MDVYQALDGIDAGPDARGEDSESRCAVLERAGFSSSAYRGLVRSAEWRAHVTLHVPKRTLQGWAWGKVLSFRIGALSRGPRVPRALPSEIIRRMNIDEITALWRLDAFLRSPVGGLERPRRYDARYLFLTNMPVCDRDTGWVDFRTPYSLRKAERVHRLRHGHLIPGYFPEVDAAAPSSLEAQYPLCDRYFAPYQVGASLLVGYPFVVRHFGLFLSRGTGPRWHAVQCVFDTLWVQAVAGELLSEAEDGRLWWVSSHIITRMIEVGLFDLCGRVVERTDRLKELLWEIETIRWDWVTGKRHWPKKIGSGRPYS